MEKIREKKPEKIVKDLIFMECATNRSVRNKSKKQLDLILTKCRKNKNIDCKHFLQKKIKVNMMERKDRGWSVPQSLAISYSQVKKMYPSCGFKRKNDSSPKKLVRIKVQKGGLSGYTLKLNLADRRRELNRLVGIYGWGNIVKKLNVLYIYNKNNQPANALKFRRDMKYIQKKYKPMKFL